MSLQVVFLGFIVSAKGMSVDPKRVRAIIEWPEPKNIHEVHRFHGLATFYRRFICGFSTVMAPYYGLCLERGITLDKCGVKRHSRRLSQDD